VTGELPVRVLQRPGGGVVIACLCGAESAVLRSGLANTLTGLRRSSCRPQLGTDLSPAGMARMILHAQGCLRGQNLLRGQRRAGSR
jgi:hypothetical protein